MTARPVGDQGTSRTALLGGSTSGSTFAGVPSSARSTAGGDLSDEMMAQLGTMLRRVSPHADVDVEKALSRVFTLYSSSQTLAVGRKGYSTKTFDDIAAASVGGAVVLDWVFD